jgi:hypothetical protein
MKSMVIWVVMLCFSEEHIGQPSGSKRNQARNQQNQGQAELRLLFASAELLFGLPFDAEVVGSMFL